jgi:hypothetical protein
VTTDKKKPPTMMTPEEADAFIESTIASPYITQTDIRVHRLVVERAIRAARAHNGNEWPAEFDEAVIDCVTGMILGAIEQERRNVAEGRHYEVVSTKKDKPMRKPPTDVQGYA